MMSGLDVILIAMSQSVGKSSKYSLKQFRGFFILYLEDQKIKFHPCHFSSWTKYWISQYRVLKENVTGMFFFQDVNFDKKVLFLTRALLSLSQKLSPPAPAPPKTLRKKLLEKMAESSHFWSCPIFLAEITVPKRLFMYFETFLCVTLGCLFVREPLDILMHSQPADSCQQYFKQWLIFFPNSLDKLDPHE